MPERILHSESYGAVLLSPEVPCIVIQWHGFANSAQLRYLKNRGLELYIAEASRTQPLGWVCDTRDFSAVRPDDQQWLANDWNRRAYAAGLRHLVFVTPTSVFGQMTVDTYIANTKSSPDYDILPFKHKTVAGAKRWLREALLAG